MKTRVKYNLVYFKSNTIHKTDTMNQIWQWNTVQIQVDNIMFII